MLKILTFLLHFLKCLSVVNLWTELQHLLSKNPCEFDLI